MTKKNVFLITFVLLLGGLSLRLNWYRFKSPPIQISHRSMAPRGTAPRRGRAPAVNPVLFLCGRPLRLTSVKVVLAREFDTNQYALPLWELVSASNSAPVKEFFYGVNIQGMKPAVKGATADPLEPGVAYRLLIEAGPDKAGHEFVPEPRTP